ncbi:MAG: CDP-alcohol phosphatidyltransferase family protein [Candidatus Berkiella sp.]
MIENYVRPLFQKICVDPVARRCGRYATPNVITFLSFLTGVAILPSLLFDIIPIACLLLGISGYLDTLDGTVARFRQETSDIGTILDILSDRFVEAAIIIGLYAIDPSNRGLMALCMLSSVLICVTSFLVVGIFTPNHSNKGFYYSPGLIERAEAFIFFGVMFCLPNYFTELSILFSILVVLTAIIRVYQYMKVDVTIVSNLPFKE